jgi:hypothetical protein
MEHYNGKFYEAVGVMYFPWGVHKGKFEKWEPSAEDYLHEIEMEIITMGMSALNIDSYMASTVQSTK